METEIREKKEKKDLKTSTIFSLGYHNKHKIFHVNVENLVLRSFIYFSYNDNDDSHVCSLVAFRDLRHYTKLNETDVMCLVRNENYTNTVVR